MRRVNWLGATVVLGFLALVMLAVLQIMKKGC